MASIRLENVTKRFKKTTAIDNLNLVIADGEFFCILGPPGAGKTTLLRLIVGLEKPDQGDIMIDDEYVNNIHPSQRDISMIFQNLALYPDKTVFENIAFPLKQQKVAEEEIDRKVKEVTRHLKLDWMLQKLPSQLSGGERQRVAIGRAIVRQPRAYLMDEPLSNLDALLRLEMRVALKELQTNLKETFVYVTHDQVEALSMGDRIAVLNHGVLQQVDDPSTIYSKPTNMFVATILGSPPMNFFKCKVEADGGNLRLVHTGFTLTADSAEIADRVRSTGDGIVLGVRPEDIHIHQSAPSGRTIPAEIYVTEPLGNETIVDVKVGENVIKVLAESDFDGNAGDSIHVSVDAEKLHLFDSETHECMYHTDSANPLVLG